MILPKNAAFGSSIQKRKKVLVADLFCGAGGSSTGAKRALSRMGLDMVLTCVNHWPTAIATHERNHPDARHFIMDLATANPMELVPEGRLDLLMASPSCTHHSRARGGKPTSDQQRMDPWHVLDWLSMLRVKRLLIENVPEFMTWGPVNPRNGKPLKSRKGQYFNAWLAALQGLGYKAEFRILNAADYGDATTRERFFLMARNDGKPIVWPEPTHSKDGAADLFGDRHKWRSAREIIDWEDPGKSIFDRKRPLSPNTIRRIATGLKKFGGTAAIPFLQLLVAEGMLAEGDLPHGVNPAASVDAALRAIVLQTNNGGQAGAATLHADDPLYTVMPRPTQAVVRATTEPVNSFVFQVNQGSQRTGIQRSVDEPIYTVVTRDSQGLAVPSLEPFVCANTTGSHAHSTEEPVPAIVTSGNLFLAEPTAEALDEGAEPFVCANRNNNVAKGVDEPVPAILTAHGGGLFLAKPEVTPFTIGQHGGATPRDIEKPIATIASSGAISFINPSAEPIAGEQDVQFLLNRHGENGTGDRSHSLDEPMPTATQRGAGYLIESCLVNMKGRSNASDVDQPAPTITAHARHLALAEATVERVDYLVVVNHGDDASGNNDRRTKSIHEPLPTITTNPSFAVTEASATALDSPDAFTTPFYGSNVGTEAGADSLDEPLATVTAKGNKHGLCEPFLTQYYGMSNASQIEEPLPTVTTKDRFALCEPVMKPQPTETVPSFKEWFAKTKDFGGTRQEYDRLYGADSARPFIVPQFGERDGQEPRTHGIDKPMPAVTSHGAGALVNPMVVQVDQTGSNGGCVRSVEQPLPTVVTKQNSAIVVPEQFVVSTRHLRGGPSPRSVGEPLPTITAGGSQVAVVESEARPAPPSSRSGRIVTINDVPHLLDIRFRMLRNKELAKAMGFTDDEHEYEFTGSATAVTRQIGNAVPCHTATALVSALMADAA